MTRFYLSATATTTLLFSCALAAYTCDPTVCLPPTCTCASLSPPVVDPPQLVQLTFDDSIQVDTITPANRIIGERKNPNNCPIRNTWYVSSDYTDYFLATQWYAKGGEAALHTMTHVYPTYTEVEGCRGALNAFAGIPRGKLSGFRHPFLNYSKESFTMLDQMGFEYDSSIPSEGGQRHWPYTLDYGVTHGCLGSINLCDSDFKAPGLWEIPMHPIVDPSTNIAYSMDPNLQGPASTVLEWLKATFDTHYNNNRAPFGLYLHPIHFSGKVPPPAGAPSAEDQVQILNEFLDYVQSKPDVYMVNSQQVIEYMKNPVSKTQFASQPYMKCPTGTAGICNGLNSIDTAQACNFNEGTIHTCYTCPASMPSISNVETLLANSKGSVPDDCDTPYWDPATKDCSCSNADCAWKDTSRAINMDPASLKSVIGDTSGGTNNSDSTNSTSSSNTQSHGRSMFALRLNRFDALFISAMVSRLF